MRYPRAAEVELYVFDLAYSILAGVIVGSQLTMPSFISITEGC
jgi:hypothetical protein